MKKTYSFKQKVFKKNVMSTAIIKAMVTATVMASAQVSAAGFQVNVQSASALGNANAGFAANTDNAAVIATNPAAAASFDKFAFSFGGAYVEPTVETTGDNAPLAGSYTALNQLIQDDFAVPTKSDYNVENSVNTSTIPSVYAVIPVSSKLAIGLAGYTNYGTNTEFPDNYAAGLLGGSTKLTTFNLNPSLAFKVGSKLRLGVGAQIVYGSAELERNLGDAAAGTALTTVLTAASTSPDPYTAADSYVSNPQIAGSLAGMARGETAFTLEGDDIGFGWNAGVLLDLNANHKIGVSYRSEVELTFEGDYSKRSDDGLTMNTGTGSLDLSLPAIAELGGFHRFGDVALQYGVVWTEWSSFEGLKGIASEDHSVLFEKGYNYEDNIRYSAGLSYYLGSKVILRAGYALDESAGDTTISIPDSERQWYTAGLTFNISKTLSIDLAAAYIVGEETSFEETDSNTGLTYAFTNKAEAIVGSAQMNLVF
ncbi:OmpP1/FadL family transporter [Moritella sp. F3]|uniref:OmpP1/FadL family transporter n=1 Tax=Moritella sp. F3 TaxID=2718882 RepID=UPI0018E0FAE4|nr:outer membrane protein transport protein [Moritella sp. F3]GIC75806.1 long-chain fatty acid outer membrane transporter [Moritella sp. F1]GIC81745.1 long-chain fatty acid outer membrane transporter [Moritella sp. F3]